MCILSYPTSKAHAPYYHVRPTPLYIFPLFLKKHIFFKLLNIKCFVLFSLQILPETFLILRKTSYKVTIILGRFYFLNLKYFDRFFKNPRMLNLIKFLPVWTEIYAGEQLGGNIKTNSAFAIFPTHLKTSYLQSVSAVLLSAAWWQTFVKNVAKNL